MFSDKMFVSKMTVSMTSVGSMAIDKTTMNDCEKIVNKMPEDTMATSEMTIQRNFLQND
jgi:hypothetical protein